MLSTNEYVHVFAFDFLKAFDTVQHSTLMSKLATMQPVVYWGGVYAGIRA